MIKDPKVPVASSSVFGWIISGPLELNLSFITGHILRCSTGLSNDELSENLSRFWNVEGFIRILRKHALHANLNKILHLMGTGTLPSYHSNQTMIPCQIILEILKFV